MKYCSDQNQVLLDAKVGILDVQLTLIPSPCPAFLLEEESGTPRPGSMASLIQAQWPWESTACTGSENPPTDKNAPLCYAGEKMGETVMIHMEAYDTMKNSGSVNVLGSGLAPVKCQRGFSKNQQMISVTNLEQCLPRTVKPSGVKYCSDQNSVILDATVGMISVQMVLKPTPCPSALIEQGLSNDLLSHSAWIWGADVCTGTENPPSKAPFCYSGSKMGEVVSIKVNSFDAESNMGDVYVTGSGLAPVKCQRSFSKTKTEQFISVPELENCLPSTVKPDSMKYCSDQNQVLLDAKVGIIPVQMVLIPSPCPTFLLLEETSISDGSSLLEESSQSHVENVVDNEWAWDTVECTGSSDPPTHAPFCYSGSKLGEAVTIKVHSFDKGKSMGSVGVLGSGLSPVHCQRDFSKSQQMISVTNLDECLPTTVKPSGLKYCSDQDHVILDATVGLMSVEMVLKQSPCPSAFLEESYGENIDLFSHSHWIWDANSCTGSHDPPNHAPFCYSGSKMGEIVAIKVNSFDSKLSAGSVSVIGSGLSPVKCRRDFSKAEQLIKVDKLESCLPSTVIPNGLKYCSDQNQVLLDAKVGIVPVQMVLIPSPCPTALLQESDGSALVETQTAWPWESTECTGTGDPLTHAPFCYSGGKMGEKVTIKVDSFDSHGRAGSVLVAASGLAHVKCKRDFLKAQQMINVAKLDECLPKTIKHSGVKYCSDQDKVILDATIGLMSVEMVLSPTSCPVSFLEEVAEPRHPPRMQGQVLATGNLDKRLIRKE
jgi:hypothetical protein